jgi:DNA mismatch endonuclease (patch repair protein)
MAKTNAAYWAEKVATNVRRDEETNELLRETGWTVIRVWEHVPSSEAADEVAALVRGDAPRAQSTSPSQ